MGINRMNENSIRSEILNDFGMKMPRVLVSGRYAVVDSVKKIYVLSCDIVTLETSEGYISILGNDICVETLCDERIELCGDFTGVEFIRPQKTEGKRSSAEKKRKKNGESKGSERRWLQRISARQWLPFRAILLQQLRQPSTAAKQSL